MLACLKVMVGHGEAVHQEKAKPSLHYSCPLPQAAPWSSSSTQCVTESCQSSLLIPWGPRYPHSLRPSLQVSPTGIEAGNPKICIEVTPLVSLRCRTQGVSPEE